MVSERWQKVKALIKENENDIVIASGFLLIALIGFGLGRLSALKEGNPALKIEKIAVPQLEPERQAAGLLVGSKNGTAYHLPACPGANRIKEENKIWFASREEAEKLGYKPASNCEGLQ